MKGYKNTDIGLIPDDWSVCRIGDVILLYSEKTSRNNQYPVLTSSRSGLSLQSEYFEEQVTREDNIGYNVIPRGYITYRSRSDDGTFVFNQNIIIDKGIVSCFYPVFRFNENKVDPYYLLCYMNQFLKKQILKETVGTSQLVLSIIKLKTLKIPCPNIEEQHKVAAILSTWDKAIQQMDRLIEKKKELKKGLMQKLLDPGSGLRLSGYNGKWNKKSIGELFKFLSSISAPREQLGDEGFCYLHYGDIHKSTKTYINVSAEFNKIPKIKRESVSKNTLLKHGDVVFVDASEDYEGASKYLVIENESDIPFIAGLHTIGIRSKDDSLDHNYKKYCFQSNEVKKQIAFYTSGMKVYGLSKYNMAKITVRFPEKTEQRAIASILTILDREIDLIEKKREQFQKQKKALMQLLLTGIVRVRL